MDADERRWGTSVGVAGSGHCGLGGQCSSGSVRLRPGEPPEQAVFNAAGAEARCGAIPGKAQRAQPIHLANRFSRSARWFPIIRSLAQVGLFRIRPGFTRELQRFLFQPFDLAFDVLGEAMADEIDLPDVHLGASGRLRRSSGPSRR